MYLGLMGNWGKTEVQKHKVSERWRRKCHGLEDVFGRSLASYTATR